MIAPMIVPIKERVRELHDREQRACMARHVRKEVREAIEKRILGLSDQENSH